MKMTFKEKVELMMYMALWSQSVIKDMMQKDYQWHDFATKVIKSTILFSDKMARHTYHVFLVTPHTKWQLENLEQLMIRYRPDLALELGIVGSEFDILAEMIRDPGFSDHAVMCAFEQFMEEDKTGMDSVDLFRLIGMHRPSLAAEFGPRTSTH